MRNTVIEFLFHQASIDPNLYLIVGDVGFSVIEAFEQKFGKRFINAGIAEQHMIGLAAGLAMTGKRVYVYSIIPFVTMRCYEQIRNDLCYQQLPVKLIGVGGGFSYGPMGVTHHALEDVALMRSLPGMTVLAPGSKYEVKELMPQIHALNGPAYIRCGNNEDLTAYPAHTVIILGKAIELVSHNQHYIVATGNALDLGVQVQQYLQQRRISIGLVSMPTIKPLDREFFLSKQPAAVFTIEEHSVIGGLGEAVARLISEEIDHKVTFHAFGVNDFYYHTTGSRAYLKENAGLSIASIAETITYKLREISHVSSSINLSHTNSF